MLKEITDDEFASEVEADPGVVLVDFWAPWCGPCRMMAPVYQKMAQKYPGIKFLKVNTDNHSQKAMQYGVSGIPCIIVFQGGREVDRIIGFHTEPDFDDIVSRYAN